MRKIAHGWDSFEWWKYLKIDSGDEFHSSSSQEKSLMNIRLKVNFMVCKFYLLKNSLWKVSFIALQLLSSIASDMPTQIFLIEIK